jgi:hypothetical protein
MQEQNHIPKSNQQHVFTFLHPIVTGYGVAGQQPNYGYWVWKSGCLV